MTTMSTNSVTVRVACRMCGNAKLEPIISFGELYVSDFLGTDEEDRSLKAPLEVVFCNPRNGGCGLIQLKHTVSHEAMYRNYWYRSGMNQTMMNALKEIAQSVESLVDLKPGDSVLDIGANDGTLLRGYTTKGLHLVGFEPAKNLGQYNSVGTTNIINDFFNYGAWEKEFPGKKAKAVTAIAMFYDLEEPNVFVADVAKILDPESGVFIIQQAYLPLMLRTNEIGNICHEHLEYYALMSMENLLKRHNLEIFDVVTNDINGGSFRTYIRHKREGSKIRVPQGAAERLRTMRDEEAVLKLDEPAPYEDFAMRVNDIRDRLVSFLKEEKAKGKKIYGYGASTKGNTLLQYFGIGPDLITAIAERNPDKWGKKTVGTLIPIVSEDEARAAQPDYFLILPWHFLDEFKKREADFLKRGGKFIVPMPDCAIIEYE
jgi:NDP-4-keto-2,6-dideoxyhexose 3-C-methyltransferase